MSHKNKNLKKDLPKEENKEINKQEVKEPEVEEVVTDVNEKDPRDEEIEKLKTEVAKLKNAYAMAYADTENLKKRLEAEAATTKKYRIQSFAVEILPVLDNLERALATANKDDQFTVGIQMIYDQLIKALKNEGVEEIDCLNKEFDSHFAQSIMVEKKEGVKPNMVIEILQKGYMLKDRVLRAAMVKISE